MQNAYILLNRTIYKIFENHINWPKTVSRRARFQTGFSHPVDPGFQIFLAYDHLREKSVHRALVCIPRPAAFKTCRKRNARFKNSEILLFYRLV